MLKAVYINFPTSKFQIQYFSQPPEEYYRGAVCTIDSSLLLQTRSFAAYSPTLI